LQRFSEAVNSLLFVQGQKLTNQAITQQPAKSAAIDDLDGLF